MGMERIETALAQARDNSQVAIIPYLTVGFPSVDATLELVSTLADAGAAVIELGIPFSDPLADGVTIQHSTFHALQEKVTPQMCLDVCSTLRERGLEVPLVLMGYYNPIYAYGLDQFTRAAREAGVDGLIVADLPSEESSPLRKACTESDLALIPLLAPTSNKTRVAAACEGARGFVYCISVTGVTGARDELPSDVHELVSNVRRHTDLAVAVGFGVSTKSHVEELSYTADAVVIGSAFIRAIDPRNQQQSIPTIRGMLEEFTGISTHLSRED